MQLNRWKRHFRGSVKRGIYRAKSGAPKFDVSGEPSLCAAIRYESLEVVQELLGKNKKEAMKVRCDANKTLLHLAAMRGDEEVRQKLKRKLLTLLVGELSARPRSGNESKRRAGHHSFG